MDLLAPAEPLDNYSPSRQLDSNLMKSFELEPHRCFCCSVAQSCPTLCNPMDCSTPGLPVLHHLPELAQTHVHSVTDANHLILCRPHLLLPSIFPSIRVFYNELALCNRWPKYWSFSFCISPAAAAAKSFQSCPTLCDPRDGSPPGSPIPGILQARTPEWVAISFSNA